MSNDTEPLQVLFQPSLVVSINRDGSNASLHDIDFFQSIDNVYDPHAELGKEISYDFDTPAALAAMDLIDPKIDAIKEAVAAILAGKTVTIG